MFEYQHLCILITAQNQWKDQDYTRFSNETVTTVHNSAAHATCGVCMTCLVCRATWDLFDPENPGEYVPECEYCDVLLPYFEEHRKSDNLLLFSHENIKFEVLKQFVEQTLESNKIKKIFILQLREWDKKKPKANELISLITQRELTTSEFIKLLQEDKFEFRVLYEIFKDKYY